MAKPPGPDLQDAPLIEARTKPACFEAYLLGAAGENPVVVSLSVTVDVTTSLYTILGGSLAGLRAQPGTHWTVTGGTFDLSGRTGLSINAVLSGSASPQPFLSLAGSVFESPDTWTGIYALRIIEGTGGSEGSLRARFIGWSKCNFVHPPPGDPDAPT
ncbi:MAG: hypothetical protein ACRD3Q_22025 [Terriglobales bacterium]